MARNLTEDEVKWIEERRKQQEDQSRRDDFEGGMSSEELAALDQRRQEMAEGWRKARVSAMGDAARGWRRGQAEREAAERSHWDELHRQTHGGLSRSEVLALGPDGSGRQGRGIARAAELQAAREHEAGMQDRELDTSLKEAEQKRLGMENQGLGAATTRANADKDMLGLTLGDKEKQRQHELAMLGQTQTFQGAQNDAERKNRLEIAGVQGSSAVDAARAQAEARAAEVASKERIAQGNVDARNHATDTRAATAAARQQNELLQTIIGQKNALGQAVFTKEQQELLAKLLAQRGQ